jgi:hypothetical protein
MMESTDDFLTNLKKGDPVFVTHFDYRGEQFEVDKIKRVSPTMITLEKNSVRFRRNTGSQIKSDRWVIGSKIHPFTEKNREEYNVYRKKNKFKVLVNQLSEWVTDKNLGSVTGGEELDGLISKISVINDELIKKG